MKEAASTMDSDEGNEDNATYMTTKNAWHIRKN